MKLVYRGVSYDYNPQSGSENASDANRTSTAYLNPTLRYRGATYQVNPGAESQSVRPIAHLVYRGVAYVLDGDRQVKANVTQPVATVQSRVTSTPKAAAQSNLAMVHRNNVYRTLQHRIQVAQERGDQNLVQLLERELQQSA